MTHEIELEGSDLELERGLVREYVGLCRII